MRHRWMRHPRAATSIALLEAVIDIAALLAMVNKTQEVLLGLAADGRRSHMARTVAGLPAGSRITDYISLGVIAKFFPTEKVHAVLQQTNRDSIRERDLPAHVVVYYVIALALYMRSSYREVLRCLLEGVQWLLNPSIPVKVAGKSGISQARSRLGVEPLKKLYEMIVAPIAAQRTKGA